MYQSTTPKSSWWNVGATLFVGLFVAYIDRTNLSVALPKLSSDLGFGGANFAVMKSFALTIFLMGYACANVLGGFITRRFDPKTVVICCFAVWSVATILVGFTSSIDVLLGSRLVLGVAEGIYWPQLSRFVRNWFAPQDATRANSIIQYFGQYVALAIGFIVLVPINDAFGWRSMFFITGGLGLVVIVPLFLIFLKPEREAPIKVASAEARSGLTLAAFGGPAFFLLVFSYITQGMLFWGITLWIPQAVKSLGFTGEAQAFAAALPYAAAVAFAIPLAWLSDRTGKRIVIAAAGLILPGLLLLTLPMVSSGGAKLVILTVALGYYAGSYTPNIWSILQALVEPRAVGVASGIMNGLGAGAGGTLAGFLVGMLQSVTGSYETGFMVLGLLVVFGGIALFVYDRMSGPEPAALAL